MNNGTPTVRLELDSRPECLTLVRGALSGIGETLAFDPGLLDDVKTAISEACSNVVLHAYEGAVGPLFVIVAVGHDRVDAAVLDRGTGIREVSSDEDRMGVGLAVITALAERAEFVSKPGLGTEVRMAFAGRVGRAPATADLSGAEPPDHNGPHSGLADRVVVSLSTPELLGAVLGRVSRGAAAGSHFSVDRLRDLKLVADALATHARTAAIGAPLRFTVSAATRRLELSVGPFRTGTFTGLGPDVAKLSDDVSVDGAGDSETVRLVVSDSRRR